MVANIVSHGDRGTWIETRSKFQHQLKLLEQRQTAMESDMRDDITADTKARICRLITELTELLKRHAPTDRA